MGPLPSGSSFSDTGLLSLNQTTDTRLSFRQVTKECLGPEASIIIITGIS